MITLAFPGTKKTAAKKMRLSIRYVLAGKEIVYVDKNLPDGIAEYQRLLDSIVDCRRQLARGPQRKHHGIRMAMFVLDQVRSDHTQILEPKHLARELCKLNGCLEEARQCVLNLSPIDQYTKAVQFMLLYRQTARKRDINVGWNRSAMSDDVDDSQKVHASDD